MTERDYTPHPEQPERSPEEMDGTNLLPEALKERMPALYSKEAEDDPMVECKFFDPVGSWVCFRQARLTSHFESVKSNA